MRPLVDLGTFRRLISPEGWDQECGATRVVAYSDVPHSWPQVSGDINLRKVPRSRSGRTYVTEWRTNKGKVIALIDQSDNCSCGSYEPDWSSSASDKDAYAQGECEPELWERVAASKTSRPARTAFGRKCNFDAMREEQDQNEYLEENGELPDIDCEESESLSTDWMYESEGWASRVMENSDGLMSCREASGGEPPSEASGDESLAEFFTPRPSDPDAEVPGFGSAVATPTHLREAGEATNRHQL